MFSWQMNNNKSQWHYMKKGIDFDEICNIHDHQQKISWKKNKRKFHQKASLSHVESKQ
jgi:uncharacterized DUF497 family protein